MSDFQLSLSEYLNTVSEIIKMAFGEAVWVKAEIRNLNIKAGHYYLELAEKEQDSDKVIAQCKGTIWKFSAQKIVSKFERESGIEFDKGLNVLIKVRAKFDAQYGFSVNIEDIDSSFTLGELAKRYLQIVDRLTQEQLIHRNKLLATPFDIEHVLVIAPENAAGLGDFKKDADQLQNANLCQFVYYSATFQGNTAPQSIIQALGNGLRDWAEKYDHAPDLIVIIRGGGSVNDLAYLNDYELAALLCKRSVPIWVGIGHEKDRTILDEVAHRSFDTPSKVIAGIRNVIVERAQYAADFLQMIKLHSKQHISAYQNQNDQCMQLIETYAKRQVSDSLKNLQLYKSSTAYFAQQAIKSASMKTESLMRETLLQNPKNVMAKGYAIIRHEQKAIKSVAQIHGDRLAIEMQDGTIDVSIQQINHVNP